MRTHHKLIKSLSLFTTLSLASQLSQLENSLGIQTFAPPALIFSSNNDSSLQLLGSYDALSLYTYTGQQNFSYQITPDTNSNGLVYYSNNTLIQLNQGLDDTRINNIVPIGSDSFILSGSGSLNEYSLENQLFYNLSSLSVYPIFNTTLEQVESILVDEDLVYFGGNFTFSNGTDDGHSVAVWNITSNSTGLLPFLGFGENSSINNILRLNDDNILFAGEFYTLDDASLLTSNTSNATTNIYDLELSPLLPLNEATWSSDVSDFDASSFICVNPDSDAWFVSGTTGTLACSLPYDSALTKIRIYNSPDSQNQISEFRLISDPSGSIMNMTYIDPRTGNLEHCDSYCPLLSRDTLSSASDAASVSEMARLLSDNATVIKWSAEYQEFGFVNVVSTTLLQFLALNSYGSNVALAGYSLYQDEYAVFANNSLNGASCTSNNSDYTSSTLSDNDWVFGASGQTYVTTFYTEGDDPIPQVTFNANLPYSGDYVINLYTPGCSDDGTCSTRGLVNVTVYDESDDSILSTVEIYQNNEALKYDELFSGYLKNSVRIVLEYVSGISSDSTGTTVVADRSNIYVTSLDILGQISSSKNGSTVALNGLFQYQLSNFSSTFNSSSAKVGKTFLNQYPLDIFNTNSSLFASTYDNYLLVGGAEQSVYALESSNDLNFSTSDNSGVEGQFKNMQPFSEGIFLYGNFNLSGVTEGAVTYNGSFNPFTQYGNSSIDTFKNVTFGNSEILVFNNAYLYNVSSSTLMSNSSSLSLSLWSAGANANGDLLFNGASSQMSYSFNNESINIGANNIVQGLNFNESIDPYLGLYMNTSHGAYFYQDDDNTRVYFTNGSQPSWQWPNDVVAAIYSDNQSLLIAGTSSSLESSSFLTVLNTTTYDVIANESLSSQQSQISGIVNFASNATAIIGGNFSMPNVNCFGLCLFNYGNSTWSSFADASINGTVDHMQLFNESELIVSGLFSTKNISSITMASLNLKNNKITALKSGESNTFKSFTVADQKIVAWNNTALSIYEDNVWTVERISNINSSSVVDNLNYVTLASALSKRDTSSSDAILVSGQLYDNSYGHIQAMVYDFSSWVPYLLINSESDSSINAFIDRDMSSFTNTQVALLTNSGTVSNSSSSTTSPGASASATSIPNKTHKRKIDRGFVVLLGLALALGTVAVLGIAGVIMAYVFRDDNGAYEPINPRIDENEMIETVPPEKLMKYI
ncbi:hypothetical protein KAFR_0B02690 [Kazachstania africana CBS 2517]|uniref:Bud site selection protein RAX2 n=1 Tax=Kazachstania africana (strain ATCC 22294 / BCRC 22015 / CBS 2517 / CECT 1963 / NBRC 1671 / NRRL Y-8276) TaxID=1071382 RepID=H2AQB6_KAZAF|nr:hypothetical protein KAFR_0B02690 [Kazachstania africana CBS 2517]CCF56566.1 hypothetical protein KAFR_0B02690 [Kazachstania africana CBS 2517]